MIITFIGHASVSSESNITNKVKTAIEKSIYGEKNVICYLGGYGAFDEICASACRELKSQGVSISTVFVTPYFDLASQEKIKKMQILGAFDSSLYPPIENVPKRFAIIKRNEWMIKNADLIIAYISHGFGGAHKSFLFAKRMKKKIINICEAFIEN